MVENPSKDKVNRAKQPERASESVTDDANEGREEERELWIFKSICAPSLSDVVWRGPASSPGGRRAIS